MNLPPFAHTTRRAPALAIFAALPLVLLCACSPDLSNPDNMARAETEALAHPLPLSSTRHWRGWRVDCLNDSTDSGLQNAYAFEKDDSPPNSNGDFESPSESARFGTLAFYWIADRSSSCRGKDFYAATRSAGSLVPASLASAYQAVDNPRSNTVRYWKGMRVDCLHDSSWNSSGKDFYQARPHGVLESSPATVDSPDFKPPIPVARVGSVLLYWVHDTSASCSGKGFYAMKDNGNWAIAGSAYSYSSGKSTKGSAQFFMKNGEIALDR